MEKHIPLKEILVFLGDDIKTIYGNPNDKIVCHLRESQYADELTLDWISHNKSNFQQIAENSNSKIIIAGTLLNYSNIIKNQEKVIILVDNPKLSIAKVGNHFFSEKPNPGIHATAIISPDAIIGDNIYIGPNTTIGKCTIGNNCFIYPGVTIYDRAIIGNNVSIHSGSVICTDGLGCTRLESGELIEFPQLGGVIIEDNVYIGANSQIVCGSLSNTIIGKGSKINGQSFIGSNCVLGNNIWITGSSMLAGSVNVGNNTTIFSKVIIRDQCKIGKNVIIGMGSTVTKNIPDGEVWLGSPAKKRSYDE